MMWKILTEMGGFGKRGADDLQFIDQVSKKRCKMITCERIDKKGQRFGLTKLDDILSKNVQDIWKCH